MTGFGGRSRTAWSGIRTGILVLLAWTTWGASPVRGQAGTRRATVVSTMAAMGGRTVLSADRALTPLDIDGRLDEPVWDRAQVLTLAWEVSPGDNQPAPVATLCRVTYDDEHLYVGCEAEDPRPEEIRAFITDRDDLDGQDRIVITVDPFNDARRGFEFGISPLGVQYDAVYNPVGAQNGGDGQTGPSDPSWDAIWSSSGRITGQGYVVEAAIPFKSLRFPAAEGSQTWGFFASRLWPRSDNVDMRSMRWDQSDACVLCQANLLTGLEDVSPGGAFQVTPTFTAGRTDGRGEPGDDLSHGAVLGEVGLDGTWRLTSDLTLNATLNPDFSQVEADAPQLDVNTRFALFFPEKRPFFLEGADFFNTPIQTVFTRTIQSPSLGAKLTGKSGATALGILVARDRTPSLTLPGSQSSRRVDLDLDVTNVVARFRRDVGASSTVGALLAAREGTAYHNRTAGADAYLRITGALTARAQILHSRTDYPDDLARQHEQPTEEFAGTAALAQLDYSTREWSWGATARVLERGFRADAGFVNQVDMLNHWSFVQRSWWADEPTWYTSLRLGAGLWSQTVLGSGDPVNQGAWVNFRYQGPGQSILWLTPDFAREGVDGRTFGLTRLWMGGELRASGSVAFRFDGMLGGAVDYANVREGLGVRFNPGVDLRLGRNIDLRLSHSLQRLSNEGRKVFHASVSQVRAVYNFSPRMFVRSILQYRRTSRNTDLYEEFVDAADRGLATQLLLAYKLNPLSVVFLGYSDNRVGRMDADEPRLPLTLTGRSVFLKVGYAWRP